MPVEARPNRMQSWSTLIRDTRGSSSLDNAPTSGAQREWTLFEDVFLQNRTNIGWQRPATAGSLRSTGSRGSAFVSGLHTEFEIRRPSTSPESSEMVGSEDLGERLSPAADFHDGERAVSPESTRSLSPTRRHFSEKLGKWFNIPQLSTVQKDIIKCSTAYLIGSLFTFVPYFASFISDIVPNHGSTGPSPSGHMVATGT